MRDNYKEIEFGISNTIGEAVAELLVYREKGILVFGTFNEVKLYSDTVTMDDAYSQIVGKTKAEFDKQQQEWHDNYKREEKEHKENIPVLSEKWKLKGREILTEDKWEYWDKIIPIRLGDLYHGMELGCCLDIVRILNNEGTLNEAKEKIKSQDHSGMSFGLVRLMVKEFCDRGNEFAEYIK